jgi:two-component system, OmpR family, response regulator
MRLTRSVSSNHVCTAQRCYKNPAYSALNRRSTSFCQLNPTFNATSIIYIGEDVVLVQTTHIDPEMNRVFLVEDSPIIRQNLSETLAELADCAIVGCADSESDAKTWLQQHRDEWDIAIVDVFLKRGTGLPVLAATKQRNTGQRVVVLSNFASPELSAQALQLGADKVFDKSTDVDALVEFCLATDGKR